MAGSAPLPPPEYRVAGDIAIVQLSSGRECIIDTADVGLVCDRRWQWLAAKKSDGSIRTVYAARNALGPANQKRRTIYMHRLILGEPQGVLIDHVDGDGLNNRRSNLRIATPAQNMWNIRKSVINQSGVKGVSWYATHGKWCARIRIGGRTKNLGYFDSIEDAAAAYAEKAQQVYGDFWRAG